MKKCRTCHAAIIAREISIPALVGCGDATSCVEIGQNVTVSYAEGEQGKVYNEYANLLGGKQFEPQEEDPILGWRGASRYYEPKYRAAFALECQAFKRVRDDMGLTNVIPMIPFCLTRDQGRKVIAEMASHH